MGPAFRSLVVAAFSLSTLCVGAVPGQAIICRELDAAQSLEGSEAAFVGRVVDVSILLPAPLLPPRSNEVDAKALRDEGVTLVTLDVLESFKGVSPSRILIQTGRRTSLASAAFRVDGVYLIFATRNSRSALPLLWASQCDVTIADAPNGLLNELRARVTGQSRE